MEEECPGLPWLGMGCRRRQPGRQPVLETRLARGAPGVCSSGSTFSGSRTPDVSSQMTELWENVKGADGLPTPGCCFSPDLQFSALALQFRGIYLFPVATVTNDQLGLEQEFILSWF